MNKSHLMANQEKNLCFLQWPMLWRVQQIATSAWWLQLLRDCQRKASKHSLAPVPHNEDMPVPEELELYKIESYDREDNETSEPEPAISYD